jgi:asparagine synthase (glutamine-hydrolysing)
MCGIGGILRTDGQPIPEEWLDAIDARIAYRGPDGHGRFRDRVEIDDPNAPGGKRVIEVAFVHRRLSIIDHAGGAQPMVSERGRNEREGLVAVVFNGCIYNHRELRKELEAKGHRFVTDHSDTEVLIHGWREWDEQLLEWIEGMYAFAIWDHSQANLFLARDPFGEKPLYDYHRIRGSVLAEGNLFAFASSFSAIDELSGMVAAEPSTHMAITGVYLQRGYVPPQFDEAYRPGEVEPGAVVVFGGVMESPHLLHTELDWDATASAEVIEHHLRRAVHGQLEADVPVGCFLSGGVDSSLIAQFAREVDLTLLTFTVRMPDPRFDESTFASDIARHLDVKHHILDVDPNPSEDLVHLIQLLGQPFGDSSILPTYWVSKAAREHVKVAISGDGGDELFVGYDRYVAARFLTKHHRWLRNLPVSMLHRTQPKSTLNKVARLADMAADYEVTGIAAMENIFTNAEMVTLYGRVPEWNHQPRDIFAHFSDDGLIRLRHHDINSYLWGDLLRKVDTASMACGLEVRCPFLDRDLARAALSAPIEQLMPGGQRKGLLRQIARKYLPKEIVDRPKMGFAIPVGEWFRDDNLPAKGAGMKTLLLDHLTSAEPFGPIQLNRKAVQRFIDEHMSGKRDHGQRLFTLLTLSIWARQFAK